MLNQAVGYWKGEIRPLSLWVKGYSKIFETSLRSKRFRASSSRTLGREQKKRNDGGGGGERRKRLPANPTILKNCVRPRTQLLIGALLVVLITLHSKHQSNQVCFVYARRRSGLILFAVADYKCFGLIFIWIMFVRKVYQIKSIIGDRAVETSEGQFIGNDGVRIWLEKMDCLSGSNINVN